MRTASSMSSRPLTTSTLIGTGRECARRCFLPAQYSVRCLCRPTHETLLRPVARCSQAAAEGLGASADAASADGENLCRPLVHGQTWKEAESRKRRRLHFGHAPASPALLKGKSCLASALSQKHSAHTGVVQFVSRRRFLAPRCAPLPSPAWGLARAPERLPAGELCASGCHSSNCSEVTD